MRRQVYVRRLALLAMALLALASGARATEGTGTASREGEAVFDRALQKALSVPAPKAEPGARAKAVLAFKRDETVSRQVRQQAAQAFARTPEQRAELEKHLQSGKVMARFDEMLRQYGYAPQNLGDVLAAYVLISWEIANDRDSRTSPEGQKAIRRQLIGPLAALAQVRQMSDGAKQAQAERSAYLAMMAAASYQSIKREGNGEALKRLRADVRQGLLAHGVDLTQVELTDNGLVPRR